jgi:hypothetical protein
MDAAVCTEPADAGMVGLTCRYISGGMITVCGCDLTGGRRSDGGRAWNCNTFTINDGGFTRDGGRDGGFIFDGGGRG